METTRADEAVSQSSPEQLPSVLEAAVGAFYAGDREALAALLSPGCVLVGGECAVPCNTDSLQAVLLGAGDVPKMLMREATFSLTGPAGAGCSTAVVVGTCRLYSGPQEALLFAARRRFTFCCAMQEGSWKVFHIHVSEAPSAEVGEEEFPYKVSADTFEYVRSILRTGQKAGMLPSRIAIGSGGEQHLVDPETVLYVEAKGKTCIVHSLEGQFSAASLLGEVEAQLPGVFFRAHRSFLVNAAHVSGMRRFVLTLSDGTEVPIPERRYAAVRREVALRVTGGLTQ